jgi:hypothetical protein
LGGTQPPRRLARQVGPAKELMTDAMRSCPASSPASAGGLLGGWLAPRCPRRSGKSDLRSGCGASLDSMRSVAMPRAESSSKRAIIARWRASSTTAAAALGSPGPRLRSRDSSPWQYQAVTSSPTEAAAPFMAWTLRLALSRPAWALLVDESTASSSPSRSRIVAW